MSKHYFPKILKEGKLFEFDLYFLRIRQNINRPNLNKFFQYIAIFDEKYIMMIIVYGSIFYLLENKYDIFQFIVLVTLSDQMAKRLIKDIFKRRRPYRYLTLNEDKNHIFVGFKGYTKKAISSMCSSHAANFLAQAFLIHDLVPLLSPIIFPFYIIIGFARWFIGAHWVTDILVGWALGFIAYKIHSVYLYPYLISFF